MWRHRDISWWCISHRVFVALCKRPPPPPPGQGCAESFLPRTRNPSLHPVPPLLMCWDLPSPLGFGLGSHLQMVPSLLWFGQIEWVNVWTQFWPQGHYQGWQSCWQGLCLSGLLPWAPVNCTSLTLPEDWAPDFYLYSEDGRNHSKCEITGLLLRPVRMGSIQPSSQEHSHFQIHEHLRGPTHCTKTTFPQIVQRLHAWDRDPQIVQSLLILDTNPKQLKYITPEDTDPNLLRNSHCGLRRIRIPKINSIIHSQFYGGNL